jgi:O-antigen/teichoic acid export membrane protein
VSENDSYTRIVKSTALFGGVQVLNLLLRFARMKVTAIFLGPSGVGILSLLTTTSYTIYTATGLGIGSTSGVRSMADAVATGNVRTIGRTVASLNVWGLLTGFLGCGVTFLFAPLFSRLTFASEAYTPHFRLLALTLLLMSLSGTSLAVLQGTRKLKALAAANTITSLVSVAVTIPLIVLLREEGIVPSLIAGALAATVVAWGFLRRARLPKAAIPLRESITTGVDMVKLGTVMTVNIFLGWVSFYAINAFVSHTGGPAEVGLYQAGVTLTTIYVGMIFTAMGTDYFPRLSQVNTDNYAAFRLMREQTEITTIMITPLVALFMVFLPVIIPILYTSEFAAVIPMALWAAFATIFRGTMCSLASIFVAKGDYRVSFVVENTINLVMVVSSVALYRTFGLQGLGISILVAWGFGLALNYAVAREKYGFSFSPPTLRLISIFILLGALAFASAHYLHGWRSYVFGSTVAAICVLFSYVEMRRRVDLKALVSKIVGSISARSVSFLRLGPAKRA